MKVQYYGDHSGSYQRGRNTMKTTIITKTIGQSVLEISANGYPIDHPFRVVREYIAGSLITGRFNDNGYLRVWNEIPSELWDLRKTLDLGTPDNGAMAARLLSFTNPTRADVLLPVFLFELRELPLMLRDAGRLLLGTMSRKARQSRPPKNLAASQYLAYNFGWAPLISDVKKLFSFKDNVARRAKEWDRVYSNGGLKRRANLSQTVLTGSYSRTVGYSTDLGSFDVQQQSTQNVWGTVRWRPTGGYHGKVGRPTPGEIRRMVLGLSKHNITANIWEAIPWSWLVDWFINVEDMLTSSAGRGQVVPDSINIMRHNHHQGVSKSAMHVWNNPYRGQVTLSPGRYVIESKNRTQPGASLNADIPLLSGYQLSILGSLALLKGR
jgi:hypothetical protein